MVKPVGRAAAASLDRRDAGNMEGLVGEDIVSWRVLLSMTDDERGEGLVEFCSLL